MSEIIKDDKFVEVIYEVTDRKTGQVLNAVEFPLGYVHGRNEVLMPQVQIELEDKTVGDIIEIPIDCDQIYGPRDESLVFTDRLENVPEEYREVGTTITMQSESGNTKNFIVTRMDGSTITMDGNNPLCGRDVIFKLEILTVRDATDEEIEIGGAVNVEPTVAGATKVPI